MKLILSILAGIFAAAGAFGQTTNQLIDRGNDFYRKGELEKAIAEYRKAQAKEPSNEIVTYNLANALYRSRKFDEAERLYNDLLGAHKKNPGKNSDKSQQQEVSLNQLHYNKGVAETQQRKLDQSIASYKEALLQDPTDEDARFNLQKALSERKPEQKQEQEKKDQQQQKRKQPQQQSKLNKKQVENLLKALQQREQEAQRKMQQNRTRGTSQPEKDW